MNIAGHGQRLESLEPPLVIESWVPVLASQVVPALGAPMPINLGSMSCLGLAVRILLRSRFAGPVNF